jgi:hypothetical protein
MSTHFQGFPQNKKCINGRELWGIVLSAIAGQLYCVFLVKNGFATLSYGSKSKYTIK